MKARIALLALSLALGLPLRAAPAAMDLPALAKKSRPSVLLLSVFDAGKKEIATGTGFIISRDGRVVTNHHVIENAAAMVAKGENGAFYQVAGVLAQDATNDIAILKLDANDLPALPLGDSTKAEAGQRIAVIGSPLGLEGTLSEGIISANRTMDDQRVLQISAPISPGSSGSPVLNANGEVLGVATAYLTKGQAMNIAVPVEAVKSLLPTLSAKPVGFSTSSPTPDEQDDPNSALYDDPDYKAAHEALNAEDNPKALKLANKLVADHPRSDVALFLQSEILDRLGFYSDAITSLRAEIKLEPDDESAWAILSAEFGSANDWKASVDAAKTAIKLNPEDEYAWQNLGYAQKNLQDYDAATAALEYSVKLKPAHNSFAWRLLAETYEQAGMSEKASETKERAATADSANLFGGNTPTPPIKQGSVYTAQAKVADLNGINSFVATTMGLIQKGDLSALLECYAPTVKYYDYGFVHRKFIANDFQKYFARWPHRTFKAKPMPITIENEGDGAENIHIAIEYDFFVSDIPQSRWASGTVKKRWTIRKQAGRYEILSEQETVTNRKKSSFH